MDVWMGRKRRVKKKYKNKFINGVKDLHKKSRFVSALYEDDEGTFHLLRVFDRKEESRRLNQQLNKWANLFYKSNIKEGVIDNPYMKEDRLVLARSDEAPVEMVATWDFCHQTLFCVKDNRQSEQAEEEDKLIGKSFKKILEWQNTIFPPTATKDTLFRSLRNLANRDLIVLTRFGTIWYKEDFKQVAKEKGFCWTKFVVDFNSAKLGDLYEG